MEKTGAWEKEKSGETGQVVQQEKKGDYSQSHKYGALAVLAVLLLGIVGGMVFLFWDSGSKEQQRPYVEQNPSVEQSDPVITADAKPHEDLDSTDQTDASWKIILVNGENPLPEDYLVDLVEVPGGEMVDRRIYDPLMEMLHAAESEDLGPIVVSGYRTQEKQQSLYDGKIQSYEEEGYDSQTAEALAKEWVAAPGYSEHQLGLAVDINGAVYDIYSWLQENSYQYGFIFRYPADKTDITGVAEEVWHYRYVGKEAAEEIYTRGICLEEYLQQSESALP